jgi:hypothetical protein
MLTCSCNSSIKSLSQLVLIPKVPVWPRLTKRKVPIAAKTATENVYPNAILVDLSNAEVNVQDQRNESIRIKIFKRKCKGKRV